MDFITEFLSHFVQPDPKTAALVIFNLVIIESLLSIDNAAVLATMVMDLPKEKRKLALRYGIVCAYIFRGLALIFANQLIKINWLKFAGGAYLVYLAVQFFYKRIQKRRNILDIEKNELGEQVKHPRTIPGLNYFWSTVVMVELMDLTFSIDNVFAAVAFTDNIYIICAGVFIGILSMRIVAAYFVVLLERFPFLDLVAFIVIGILGLRLCLDFSCVYTPEFGLCRLMEAEHADMYFSLITSAIFVVPILYALIARKKS